MMDASSGKETLENFFLLGSQRLSALTFGHGYAWALEEKPC
jgi:hypothetical protein